VALRKGRAAFQLEGVAELLKPIEAMHDPVVFFDEGGINALFLRDNPDQIRELRVIVEEINAACRNSLALSARSKNFFVLSFPYSRTARRSD
jgi:hypothetical protein